MEAAFCVGVPISDRARGNHLGLNCPSPLWSHTVHKVPPSLLVEATWVRVQGEGLVGSMEQGGLTRVEGELRRGESLVHRVLPLASKEFICRLCFLRSSCNQCGKGLGSPWLSGACKIGFGDVISEGMTRMETQTSTGDSTEEACCISQMKHGSPGAHSGSPG